MGPLTQPKKPILPAAEVRRIFGNWKSIMTCHLEVLDLLRERINSWESSKLIGDVFGESKMNSITQLYKFYINNFDRSLAALEHYKQKSTSFKKFLESTIERTGQLDLGGYLIMPVQRIPRYVMLLESILKCTKTTHPDYGNLEKAHERFKAMADFINQSKKNSEKFSEAKKICASIKGFPTETLLSTAGISLIKSGSLLQVEAENTQSKVFVVLLNTSLVIAETKRGANNFLVDIPLLKAQLDFHKSEKPETRSEIWLIPSRDETTVFVGEEDALLKYKLSAETEEEIETWNNEISKTIKDAVNISKDQVDDDTKEETNINPKANLMDLFIQKEVQYVHLLKSLKEFMDSSLNTLEEKTPSKHDVQNTKKLLLDFFDSTKPIIAFHINMLALLFERMTQGQDKEICVGDIFEKNLELAAPRYDLYSLLWEEVRPTYLQAKAEMSKVIPIKFWANVAKFESENGMKMEAFLEQISQRIPFMSNVLSDLTKNTPQESPDFSILERVSNKIRALSDKILTLKEISHQQEKQRQEMEAEQIKVKAISRISIKKALTLGSDKPNRRK
uniref:DH domain-containing protein n=1 Tax=Arcella intermedia TaxID=1963864 RepID=A0A6B2L0H6_9EUKA